jgi:hypothetical protein
MIEVKITALIVAFRLAAGRSILQSHMPMQLLALLAILFALITTGCARNQASSLTSPGFERPSGKVRVLLIPPDVQLFEITMEDVLRLRADWTAEAEANMRDMLTKFMDERDIELVEYNNPVSEIAVFRPEHVQLIKLHQAVATTLLRGSQHFLPTHKNRFDWTLGESVIALREGYAADYALFVQFRDSFRSTGRTALFVLGLFGGGTLDAIRYYDSFASLVDLHSGDVVWFNRPEHAYGDLRRSDRTRMAIVYLLRELPL